MPPATRVLLVAQPLVGGVPRHILDIVEELGTGNFDLTVACPPASVLWEQLHARPGVRLRPFTGRREPHLGDIAWMLRLIPLARRSDVIHAHSSKAAWIARGAALLAGRRKSCVITPHAWSFWALSGRRRRAVVVMERIAARTCAAIVVVAQNEREEGLRLGIGRAAQYHLIRNGVDARRWAVKRTADRDLVLMVGRLDPQKRPELAVRALAVARRQRPAMRLVIAGGGVQERRLRRLAAELGIADAVIFLGPRDDVPCLMARAGCVLITSAYEGCSLVVLEAMAAAVPVVAVQIAGIDELVEHAATGVLCAERPEDIAVALVTLGNDPEMGRRLGEEGRRRAWQDHSREQMARSLATLYRLLARR